MTTYNFEIQPPTTTHDNAQPSLSLERDAQRVLALMQDERILAAHALHQDVCRRLKEYEEHHKDVSPTKRRKYSLFRGANGDSITDAQAQYNDYTAAQAIFESKQNELNKLTVCFSNISVLAVICAYHYSYTGFSYSYIMLFVYYY